MVANLTFGMDRWAHIRCHIANGTLVAELDSSTLGEALTEAISQCDAAQRKIQLQAVQIEELEGQIQATESGVGQGLDQQAAQADRLAAEIEALQLARAPPPVSLPQTKLGETNSETAALDAKLSESAAVLSEQLSKFSNQEINADALHDVLLAQLGSAYCSIDGLHKRNAELRATVTTLEEQLDACKKSGARSDEDEATKFKEAMAIDMCWLQEALSETVLAKNLEVQSAQRELELMKRKMEAAQLDRDKYREQVGRMRARRGQEEDEDSVLETLLVGVKKELQQAKIQATNAEEALAAMKLQAEASENCSTWIQKEAEERKQQDEKVDSLVQQLKAEEQSAAAAAIFSMKQRHNAQIKELEAECASQAQSRKSAEDALATVSLMNDRGAMIEEVKTTRADNARMLAITKELTTKIRQKEKQGNEDDSKTAALMLKIQELEEQVSQLQSASNKASVQADDREPDVVETSTEEQDIATVKQDESEQAAVEASTEEQDVATGKQDESEQVAVETSVAKQEECEAELSQTLARMQTEKQLAVEELEAELNRVKAVNQRRVCELEAHVSELLDDGKAKQRAIDDKVSETKAELQTQLNAKESEVVAATAQAEKLCGRVAGLEEQLKVLKEHKNAAAADATKDRQIERLTSTLQQAQHIIVEKEEEIASVVGDMDDTMLMAETLRKRIQELEQMLHRKDGDAGPLGLEKQIETLTQTMATDYIKLTLHTAALLEKELTINQLKADTQDIEAQHKTELAAATSGGHALMELKLAEEHSKLAALAAELETSRTKETALQNELRQAKQEVQQAQGYFEKRQQTLERETLDMQRQLQQVALTRFKELVEVVDGDQRCVAEEVAAAQASSNAEKKALERRLSKIQSEEQMKFDKMVADLTGESNSQKRVRAALWLDRAQYRQLQSTKVRLIGNMKRNAMTHAKAEMQAVVEAGIGKGKEQLAEQAAVHSQELALKEEEHATLQDKICELEKQIEDQIGQMAQEAAEAKLLLAQAEQNVRNECAQREQNFKAEIECLSQENETAQQELGAQRQAQIEAEEELTQLRSAQEVASLIESSEQDATIDVVSQLAVKLGQGNLERDRFQRLSEFREKEIEILQTQVEKYADDADGLQDENDRLMARIKSLESSVIAQKDTVRQLQAEAATTGAELQETKNKVKATEESCQILQAFVEDKKSASEDPASYETAEAGILGLVTQVQSLYGEMQASNLTLVKGTRALREEVEALEAQLKSQPAPSPAAEPEPPKVATSVEPPTAEDNSVEQETIASTRGTPEVAVEQPLQSTKPVEQATTAFVEQALSVKEQLEHCPTAPYMTTDSAPAELRAGDFLGMVPKCRLHAFESVVEQLQQCGSHNLALEASLAELRKEVDAAEADLLDSGLDAELKAIQAHKDKFEVNCGLPHSLFEMGSEVQSELEAAAERVQSASLREGAALKKELAAETKVAAMTEEIAQLQELRKVNAELVAEINLTPGERGELTKQHAELQKKHEAQSRQMTALSQDYGKEKLDLERQIEQLTAHNKELCLAAERLKETQQDEAKRWLAMTKYINSLRHQTELKHLHTEAIESLQQRSRELAAGEYRIPQTLGTLASRLDSTGHKALADSVREVNTLFADTMDAKRRVDLVRPKMDKLHTQTLKHLHFGLNWLKIDAYDILEESMQLMGVEVRVSHFDELLGAVQANDKLGSVLGVDSFELLKRLESAVKPSQDPSEQDLADILRCTEETKERISSGVEPGHELRRDLLDWMTNRTERLQCKRGILLGEDIVISLRDVGLQHESEEFDQLVKGMAARKSWEHGIQVAESTLASLNSLNTNLETRPLKFGGERLLKKAIAEMHEPALSEFDGTTLVASLRDCELSSAAEVAEKAIDAVQKLIAGDLTRANFKEVKGELERTMETVTMLPENSTVHATQVKPLLVELNTKFQANYDFARSEVECQQADRIAVLTKELADTSAAAIKAEESLQAKINTLELKEKDMGPAEALITAAQMAKLAAPVAEAREENPDRGSVADTTPASPHAGRGADEFATKVLLASCNDLEDALYVAQDELASNLEVETISIELEEQTALGLILSQSLRHLETQLIDSQTNCNTLKKELERARNNVTPAPLIQASDLTNVDSVDGSQLQDLRLEVASLTQQLEDSKLANTSERVLLHQELGSLRKTMHAMQILHRSEKLGLQQQAIAAMEELEHYQTTLQASVNLLENELQNALHNLTTVTTTASMDRQMYEKRLADLSAELRQMSGDHSTLQASSVVTRDELIAAQAEEIESLQAEQNRQTSQLIKHCEQKMTQVVALYERRNEQVKADAQQENSELCTHIALFEAQVSQLSDTTAAAVTAAAVHKLEVAQLSQAQEQEKDRMTEFQQTTQQEVEKMKECAQAALEQCVSLCNSMQARETAAREALASKDLDTKKIADLEERLSRSKVDALQVMSKLIERATQDRAALQDAMKAMESSYKAKCEEVTQYQQAHEQDAIRQAQIDELQDTVAWKEQVTSKLRVEVKKMKAQNASLQWQLKQASVTSDGA